MHKFKLLFPFWLLVTAVMVLPAAAAEDQDTMTVYVDQQNGVDSNKGLSQTQALMTFNETYLLLQENLSDTGTGIITQVSDDTHVFYQSG